MKLGANVLGTIAAPVPTPLLSVWKICNHLRAMRYDSAEFKQGGVVVSVEILHCAKTSEQNEKDRVMMTCFNDIVSNNSVNWACGTQTTKTIYHAS